MIPNDVRMVCLLSEAENILRERIERRLTQVETLLDGAYGAINERWCEYIFCHDTNNDPYLNHPIVNMWWEKRSYWAGQLQDCGKLFDEVSKLL